MYEELVKRLRRCEQFKCRECEYEQIMGCRAKLNSEAADAIEELSRDLDSMNDANIALYGALPKWIPVTERLPEQNGKYLAFALKEENMMDFYDGHWMLYGLDYRRYVTHWMPLPEPPKEGEA